MIAACPRCAARYRIEREKLRPEGVRLRCARCEAVFRVRPPRGGPRGRAAAAAPRRRRGRSRRGAGASAERAGRATDRGSAARAPPASPTGDGWCWWRFRTRELGKETRGGARARWGLAAVRACHDGVEAMLEIQRKLPRVVVLSAALPKMYGFQICELMKRNESLRSIRVVLVGSDPSPGSLPPAAERALRRRRLPRGAGPARAACCRALERLGVAVRAGRAAATLARRRRRCRRAAAAGGRRAARAGAAWPRPAVAPASARAARPTREGDGLAEQRAKAERLARIIVSDIVLYNEEKFAAAVRAGRVLEMLERRSGGGPRPLPRAHRRARARRAGLTWPTSCCAWRAAREA